jgi:hypothetical protein
MASKIPKIFYPVAFMLYIIFLVWDRYHSKFPFFQNLLFLTMISYYTNIVYIFFMANQEWGIFFKHKTYKAHKHWIDKIFNFLFALSFTVMVMFWSMYAKDPNSVLQQGESIPLPLNLFLHGGTFVIFLIEQLFIRRRKDKELKDLCPIWIYFIFVTCYIVLLEIAYYTTGYAVYPFVSRGVLEIIITDIGALITTLIGHFLFFMLSKSWRKQKELLKGEQEMSA